MLPVHQNIVDYLVSHAVHLPAKTAFVILRNDLEAERRISFGELHTQVKELAAKLSDKQLHGKNVLLMYQHTHDLIISFLACQYLGIVAVPVPYVKGSKQLERLSVIIEDSSAAAVCCTRSSVQDLIEALPAREELQSPVILATDQPETNVLQEPAPSYHELSFIQYTSGSTGKPKGVMISNKNLLHNQELIRQTFGCEQHSVIVSWLPFHHDMGLIGSILHTIFIGCTCVVMQPLDFMQSPLKWLQVISGYRATHSGGPNFAYDHCVDRIGAAELSTLDLSCWKAAYNGSEPVKMSTLKRFVDHFSAAGFRAAAFFPCYGLAEATLLVAGIKQNAGQALRTLNPSLIRRAGGEQWTEHHPVSAGHVVPGMKVRIIHTRHQHECTELEEGEICISGNSVTAGYWNKNNSELFYTDGDEKYLRTGDLGCLFEGELFILGRLKEMLIVRGRNIYPYDIEEAVAGISPAIAGNGVCVVHFQETEHTIILAEIRRTFLRDLDAENIIASIGNTVQGNFGITPYDIVLLTPLSIPRTTSGKLQRLRCKELYRNGHLQPISSKVQIQAAIEKHPDLIAVPSSQPVIPGEGSIRKYLLNLITRKTGEPPVDLHENDITLTELGLDSIRAMALINTINNDLNINLDAASVFRENSLSSLTKMLENILWLKNVQATGKEIIL